MNFLQSVVLGAAQGLTEFIPVSSSAHLVLIPDVLGWAQPSVLVDVLLHAGTLIAAAVYFRKDIVEILLRDRRLMWLLAIGTVPAAVIGYALKDFFEGFFTRPVWAAWFLVATGIMLVAADFLAKERKDIKNMTAPAAALVGLFQALAILPGISRSGATITAGMFTGLSREQATRFAFLLSMPIIAGTLVFKLKDALVATGGGSELLVGLPGLLAAAICGYAAIHFLIRYLSRHRLAVFALYCWLVAAAYLLTR